jgi:hypothetical protein
MLFSADPTARLWINRRVVLTCVMRFVSPQITVEDIGLAEFLICSLRVSKIGLHEIIQIRPVR